ncbi:acyl-CoA N-acyltransferase [Syncephalis pseudoplumigaleata]|uniref:Acyl-CoA N-acyltransferase n=1 Tax=Syncephalis pseudoplumigaleata TaxID=1712513 RepID=A0A4P9Z2L2_9FUNG|nr:acyl-CoA N-acyltransferase [Syncephalis pseudoplumigaleata]|eukprot:RKP26763.1 acyl-CoA N-acyltransferase [Syncephalis pseudoplumigaleata]
MPLITVVKIATPQDMADAYTVRRKVFLEERKINREVEDRAEDHLAHHWIAYQMSPSSEPGQEQLIKPVGTIRLMPSPTEPTSGRLGRVAVLKECRGQGIGRMLVQCVEAYAVSAGFKRIYMHALNDKASFYKLLGYHTYSNVFIEEDVPHIKMERVLC